jgi:Phospholipid methyltransferase
MPHSRHEPLRPHHHASSRRSRCRPAHQIFQSPLERSAHPRPVPRCRSNSFTLVPQARALVTHGIYSKIRHPVYIFSALAIAGLFLYLNRPLFFWIFLILIPLQVIRARAESRVLEARFGGAYRQYRSQTWF